jgi:hypothetical protein
MALAAVVVVVDVSSRKDRRIAKKVALVTLRQHV